MRAYGVNVWQIQGLPDWANQTAYDIAVRVPPGTTPQQSDRMLQNLLIERFGLAAHIEMRSGELYELTVAKGGSKLKPPADSSAEPSVKSVAVAGRGRVTVFTNGPVSSLFPAIEMSWRHRVVDKTALIGKYDFSVTLPLPPRAADGDNSSSDADLAWALEHDLGLKLERKKGAVDFLVIDHLDRAPTPG